MDEKTDAQSKGVGKSQDGGMGDLLISVQVLHIQPTWRYDFLEVGRSSSGPLPNLAAMEIILVPHFLQYGRYTPGMVLGGLCPV